MAADWVGRVDVHGLIGHGKWFSAAAARETGKPTAHCEGWERWERWERWWCERVVMVKSSPSKFDLNLIEEVTEAGSFDLVGRRNLR